MSDIFSSASLVQYPALLEAGPFAAVQAITVNIRVFGKQVSVEIPAITAASANAVASAVAYGVIPAALRPQAQIFLPTQILSNSLLLAAGGKSSVNTSGDITINADLVATGLWSVLGNAGWQRHCLSWCLP